MSPQILQMYASEAILERKPGPKRRDPGVGDDVPDVTRRTPAGLLLDRILETDAEQWSGILSSLAVPGKGMAGGVTKEGLLGAVQVGYRSVLSWHPSPHGTPRGHRTWRFRHQGGG